MKVYKDLYGQITSTENLFEAWNFFKRDKRNRPDVEVFEKNVEYEIFKLARELRIKHYRHGAYQMFLIHDPKLRRIHKAAVRDRVLHHAIFKVLNPIFEPAFIPTSFSCRVDKGTHKGVEYLARTLRAASKNGKNSCFSLKCDVWKFFDSIDHDILIGILEKRIIDPDTRWLMREIVESYEAAGSTRERERERERERVKIRREKEYPSAISRANFSPTSI
jgi:retron-type reverse transcriptase